LQAYRVDLKTGESRQLTNAAKLDRAAVAYLPDERTLCYFDGNTLIASNGNRTRPVYPVDDGWDRQPAFSLTDDGNHALVVERKADKRRLRMITIARGTSSTVVELEDDITLVRPRPRRAAILYGRSDSLWLVDYSGENNRKLRTSEGTPAQALWSADGKSFSYLRVPANARELHEMREHTPDTNDDKRIGATSQFVTFTRNSDASVFAGVSQNKPSPFILLFLRVTHREMTVAEHRARDPHDVTVLFTPNSQRLLWHTDREGKAAIYTFAVERFIESTDVSDT